MNRKKYCIATVIFIVASTMSLFTISIRKHSYNASHSFDMNSIHMDIENRNIQLSMQVTKSIMCIFFNTECDFIIRKTKCFDFWERNVLFPKTKRSFFRTPKHPLPCPFPLNFSLLIITKKFGNLAKNRYICIV